MIKKSIAIMICSLMIVGIFMPYAEALGDNETTIVDSSGKWHGSWFGDLVPKFYNIYDDSAQVWGNYITWRRGIDLDMNGGIQWFESSWIVVHDINSGETWNLTQTIDANWDGTPDERIIGTAFYHAEAPSIWNKKVVYEEQYGTASFTTKIVMHNITQDTYWDIPFGTSGTAYASGHEIKFYEDWILFGHYSGGVKQTYIYNWEQGYGRRISLSAPTNYNTYNYVLDDNYAIHTTYELTAPNDWMIVIHNLTSAKNIIVNATGLTSTKIRSTSIYDDYLALSSLDTVPASSWNIYLLNVGSLDWNNYPLTHNFIQWSSFPNNCTLSIPSLSTHDEIGALLWGDWVVYNINDPFLNNYNVIAYNYASHTTMNITESPYFQVLQDFKGDKIIWTDSINSDTQYGDGRDNFDIYRTLTDIENIGTNIINVVPLLIIVMAVAFIIGGFKLFGENGGSI